MSNSRVDLDVIKLIKELSKQGFKDLELEYGDLKIKLSGDKVTSSIVPEQLPEASSEQIEEIEKLEQKSIAERIKERDESLLEDLDYLSPEIAGELRRDNVIRVGSNGAYEYIEQEGLDA
jgi:hypothetical protein